MIELKRDKLVFSFPEVHKQARLTVDFQRTLRIPDDGKDYCLPPGLGSFPMRHVDDFAARVPAAWLRRGGVMLPMYQSEALWLCFQGRYPFALKVAAGKINAVTGEQWAEGLNRGPQDYLALPEQPWLDGFCVEKGKIRQFVAMPLGEGYSAEEQITGEGEHGGLQLIAYPMKREIYEKFCEDRELICCSLRRVEDTASNQFGASAMGLAPGGSMRQEIYDDEQGLEAWDLRHSSRCFVHLTNSLVWRAVTGEHPPTTPPTAKEYTAAGLPWFDWYAPEAEAVGGSKILRKLKSVANLGKEKGGAPLPENESVLPEQVIELRRGLGRAQVREERF